MKIGFELCFCRKFQVFKNSEFQLFRSIEAVSRQIEKSSFRPKLTISFDSYSIPFDQSKSVFKIFRLPLNSSRLIEFQNFQFLKRNQISIFQKILSSSSRPLSIPLHFFFLFSFF